MIHDTDISYMLPILQASLRGYCFYRLVKPFMKKSLFAWTAYFFTILMLYLIPLNMDDFTAYGIGTLLMFVFICLLDRRNYRQKAFLVIVFFSFNWLFAAMAEILYDNLYSFAENTEYMKNHPGMFLALYAGVCACYLALEFLFTVVGIWQILKVYRNKSIEMERRELVMLSLPSFIGVTAYKIIQNYRIFYIVESGEDKRIYDVRIFLFYMASAIMIVVIVVLYQEIKGRQEENQQIELLAVQIDSVRRHIKQVESLYQNMQSVRHDMTNHILTLERLYQENRLEQANNYSKSIKEELAHMSNGIESGNPVTDVILQEFKKEAEKKGILFHLDFHYPADCQIDVFDLSVILNNALQNAVENTRKEEGAQISVVSYQRNSAYIIEICNRFTGDLQWDAKSGLLTTSKRQTDIHGYGLSNIRRVARKYAGDIDITYKDEQFCLCMMLMTE